jgi:hypothetical protein
MIRSIIKYFLRDKIYYYDSLTWSDLLLGFPYMARSISKFFLHDQNLEVKHSCQIVLYGYKCWC